MNNFPFQRSSSILNTSSNQQVQMTSASNQANITYLSKAISGLMNIFEVNFSGQNQKLSSTKSCLDIFNMLISYLDSYYNNVTNTNNSTSTHNKYFNYYASIRKDIFEFLLRIRSDNSNRCVLINRQNRRTSKQSQYLSLTLNETKDYLDSQLDNDKLE